VKAKTRNSFSSLFFHRDREIDFTDFTKAEAARQVKAASGAAFTTSPQVATPPTLAATNVAKSDRGTPQHELYQETATSRSS
jgi:hypothetical protein